MNNQQVLNSVSLEEAAAIISNELIKARYELEQTKRRLLEDKKSYEEAYVLANDGDSSENAPLEAAIQNLKLVTGEIGNNARVLQIMEGLEDVQYLIGTYDFANVYHCVYYASDNVRQFVLQSFGVSDAEELGNALRATPHTNIENVIYQLAEMIEANGKVERDVECLRAINDFYQVASKPPYNTCGVVVPYTTVRLEMNGTPMTYRIYPEGVSFIDIGIMAANSRVARAILGKEKGMSVSIRHDSNNTLLVYKIVDIY